MTPKVVGALLVRNEAAPDRYLVRVLDNMRQYCDEIVVVDDGSTDGTAAICKAAGAIVEERGGRGWWGAADSQSESSAREQLWELARKHAGEQGWIYVADADHLLLGIAPSELKALCGARSVDCWAFPLWDAWDSEAVHRVDSYWQAWRLPRPWLFKALPGDWNTRAIHTGHCPLRNWQPGLAPAGAGILHLGYVKPSHRVAKRTKYLQLA